MSTSLRTIHKPQHVLSRASTSVRRTSAAWLPIRRVFSPRQGPTLRALPNRVPHQGRRQYRHPRCLPRSAGHHEVSALMPHNLAVVSDAAASTVLHGVARPPRRTLPRSAAQLIARSLFASRCRGVAGRSASGDRPARQPTSPISRAARAWFVADPERLSRIPGRVAATWIPGGRKSAPSSKGGRWKV